MPLIYKECHGVAPHPKKEWQEEKKTPSNQRKAI
jgi:hypothetical protein